MNPRYYPEFDEGVVVRHTGKLKGEIVPGEVFAWEPDKPWARQLIVVSKIERGTGDESQVWSWDIDYKRECFNTLSRFREACYRTRFNLFPTAPPSPVIPWLKDWEKER
jgi:hypothetical protein